MTRPEQPQPYPGDLIATVPGAVRHRRQYRDPLGRPMTGSVTLTGRATTGDGYVPAPVTVAVLDGVLEVELPPDTYDAVATLRTVDGARLTVRDAIAFD